MAITLLCVGTIDAGRMIGVDRTTVWRYVQRGLLQGISAGRNNVIPLYEVAHYMGITLTDVMRMTQENRIAVWNIWVERVS